MEDGETAHTRAAQFNVRFT